MRLANVEPGDVVRIDVLGNHFEARVLDLHDETIEGKPIHVEPLASWVTWSYVSARQVVERIDPPARKHRRRVAA